MKELEIISKLKSKIKDHPVVKQMFKDYDISLDELDLFPICFADIDVSAKTDHGIIYLNKSHLDDDPLGKDDHYLVHELTHVLQQTCGDKPTKGAEEGDYLANKYEQEGFQNQSEYIADTRSPEKAEKYIDHVLDYHEVTDKDREKRKDQLLSTGQNKRKKVWNRLASLNRDTYLISPDGKIIEVPKNKTHDDIAYEILIGMGEEPNDALKEYEDMGAIRVAGANTRLFFEFKHLNRHTITKIQMFIIEKNLYNQYSYIRLFGFGDLIEVPINDFMESNLSDLIGRRELKVASLFREDYFRDDHSFRYFISPDNKYIEIPKEGTHEEVASGILHLHMKDDPVSRYLDKGAIRLSGYSDKLSVELNHLSNHNIDRIQDFLIHKKLFNKIKMIYIKSLSGNVDIPINEFMAGEFQKVAALNWQEVSQGWWISPNGSVIEVPSDSAHDIVAWEILDPKQEKYNNAMSAKLDLLDLGAIMIREYGGNVNILLNNLDNKKIRQIAFFLAGHNFSTVSIEDKGKFMTMPIDEFIEMSASEIKRMVV
jgi:hypothetical protein